MSGVEVGWLSAKQADEAAKVMSLAFARDPIVEFYFGRPEMPLIERMFQFSVRGRLETGVPIPAVLHEGRVAGVAHLSLPDTSHWPAVLSAGWDAFLAEAGQGCAENFAAYDAAHERNVWPEPHAYLTAIGVAPEFQGRGYGRALMSAVAEFARKRGLGAVALDTGVASNVPIYERCGYRLWAQDKIGDVPLWFMVREL